MNLKELGLNSYESKAYEALVHYGKSTASKISKESGVPHSKIYEVLASLEHKGFSTTIPGKIKLFAPTSPDKLLEIISKKKQEIQQAEKIAVNLKKIYSEEKEPIIVATGKSNFYKINEQLVKPNKSEYNIRYNVEPHPKFILNAKNNINKIDTKNLVRYDDETKKNISKWPNKLKNEFRVIKNKGVALSIIDEKEVLIGLLNSNSTLLIKDEAFATLMKELYLEKWKASKRIY